MNPKSINYCPECGEPLKATVQNCPNCGILIPDKVEDVTNSQDEHKLTQIKPIRDYKKKPKDIKFKFGFLGWILLFLGSALGLYALTTPAGSVKITDIYSWDMWMYGFNVVFDSETGLEVFWTLNENYLMVSLISTVFVLIGNITAIVSGFSQIIKGIHKSYVSIAAPAILFGSCLFYLAGYQVLIFFDTGESFWSILNPGFAVYGQFLAALIMIPAFFIIRKSAEYVKPLKKNLHQTRVFNMLKGLLETKSLSKDDRDRLSKELEIISLRLKGVASLEKTIKYRFTENQGYDILKKTVLLEAIYYFQQALDLSSIPLKDISFNDLNLVKKIDDLQDIKVALNYLDEINNHTTVLLGEMLKKLSFGRVTSKSSESRVLRREISSQNHASVSRNKTSILEGLQEKPIQSSSTPMKMFPPISELRQEISKSASEEPSEFSVSDKELNDEDDKSEETEEGIENQ